MSDKIIKIGNGQLLKHEDILDLRAVVDGIKDVIDVPVDNGNKVDTDFGSIEILETAYQKAVDVLTVSTFSINNIVERINPFIIKNFSYSNGIEEKANGIDLTDWMFESIVPHDNHYSILFKEGYSDASRFAIVKVANFDAKTPEAAYVVSMPNGISKKGDDLYLRSENRHKRISRRGKLDMICEFSEPSFFSDDFEKLLLREYAIVDDTVLACSLNGTKVFNCFTGDIKKRKIEQLENYSKIAASENSFYLITSGDKNIDPFFRPSLVETDKDGYEKNRVHLPFDSVNSLYANKDFVVMTGSSSGFKYEKDGGLGQKYLNNEVLLLNLNNEDIELKYIKRPIRGMANCVIDNNNDIFFMPAGRDDRITKMSFNKDYF